MSRKQRMEEALWAALDHSFDALSKHYPAFNAREMDKTILDRSWASARLSATPPRAGLEYAVCLYDIRRLWITTMLDKKVEISAIAHLAGASPRMLIENYDEAHASETEKAAALLQRLGEAREALIRLVRPVQAA